MTDQGHRVHDLTAEEVSRGMAEGRYLLVDVREPNEVAVDAYPGAVVVPLSSFDPQAIPDPKGKQVVFACRSGKRSVTASLAAQAAGLALRQTPRGRDAGLERRRFADEFGRLIIPMTSLNKVFGDLPVTVFEAMSQLARDNNAINLGQGFPDDPGPEDIRKAAADAVDERQQPIPVDDGHSGIAAGDCFALSALARPRLDPMTEVMVTSGGTEALTSAILAVVEPGDEVVVFQPVYDSYLPIIRQAGGIPRLVRLEPPHWRLTEEALRSVFNRKTKAVLFNNPLNPAAVVYPREDLELLARYCQEFDVIAICDEVWEHVIFDGRAHIPLITIPGMRDRTIKVGSAGKIFSLTGWKIGFVCAAPPLLRVAAKVHQFLTFTTAPNLQAAVAYGLGKPDEYFHEMRKDLARSRDRLTSGLESLGFPVLRSQGTYFLTVDLSPLGLNETDEAFCKRIVTDYKVAAIPVSAFYEQDAGDDGGALLFCQAGFDARHRARAFVGCGAPAIAEISDAVCLRVVSGSGLLSLPRC